MKNIHARIDVFSEDEVLSIHKSALRILEHTGFMVPNEECLNICEKAGAKVDRIKSVVKIPNKVMGDILDLCKKAHADKVNAKDDIVGKLTGLISTQVFVADYHTKSRRYGTVDDVMKGLKLVEHLDNIPMTSSVTIPSNVHSGMTDIISHQLIYNYSKKDGSTYILTPKSAKYIIQMSKVMGREVKYLLETVSPLQFRKESLEMALIFAKAGCSLYMAPMVIAGASGPVTLAGTVTLQNAEILASLFMIYILTGKYPAFNAGTHTMDMKTMLCSFGAPNQALIGLATAQMGRYYGLPNWNNTGLTDSLLPDFQCGFEKAISAVLGMFAGSIGMGCQGIVGADQGFSFEQLVIDNEWIDEYNYITRGIEVNEDTIAEDLINTVGIAGYFLSEEHTAQYMRDNFWPTKLFNRDSLDKWKSDGAIELLSKAHDYVETVTEGYMKANPVICSSKVEELDYIVKCAKDEIID